MTSPDANGMQELHHSHGPVGQYLVQLLAHSVYGGSHGVVGLLVEMEKVRSGGVKGQCQEIRHVVGNVLLWNCGQEEVSIIPINNYP